MKIKDKKTETMRWGRKEWSVDIFGLFLKMKGLLRIRWPLCIYRIENIKAHKSSRLEIFKIIKLHIKLRFCYHKTAAVNLT